MDHPEGLGYASASEVPARPRGSGYNFQPRSRSATAPKNRRLGSVETPGAGSTLDLPTVTPPNSPTPRGAGNPTHVNIPTHGNAEINTEIIFHDLTTESSPPFSQPMSNTATVGVAAAYSTLSYTRLDNHVESSKFHTCVTVAAWWICRVQSRIVDYLISHF